MPELGSRSPVLGSPNPSYPALGRPATSCAWRNRLRRIPLGRSDCSYGQVPAGRAGLSVAAPGGQNTGGTGLTGIPGWAWRPKWPEGRRKGGMEESDVARHMLRTLCPGGQERLQ